MVSFDNITCTAVGLYGEITALFAGKYCSALQHTATEIQVVFQRDIDISRETLS